MVLLEQYPSIGNQIINICGHFMDSLIMMYFWHRFMPSKKQIPECLWMAGTVGMTVLLQAGDYISGNNRGVWMFLLFAIPFICALVFKQGDWQVKFLMCGILHIMQGALETFGTTLYALVKMYFTTENYCVFLFLYFFRRIILKLVLLLFVKFLLKYLTYSSYYKMKNCWRVLGMICLIEYGMLIIFREIKSEPLYLIIAVFCCLVPILFSYMVYLIGTNLIRIQIGVNQENYINIQEQYMTQLITMQDSLRKFQHDYKAHLFCIDNLLLGNNYEELHEYLKNIHDLEKYDSLSVYTSDQRLNMILNQMHNLAEKKEIELNIVTQNVAIERIALYDLNMLLSNLCNNAIEAAVNTEEKKVELFLEKNRAYLQVTIGNSVISNPLADNPGFVTSKDDKTLHGFGMEIIRNVVEKYQGMIQMDGTDKWLNINVLLMDEI